MFRLFLIIATISFAFMKVNASELYVDMTTINAQQVVVIEKNGLTTILPVTAGELEADKLDDNILKKVCSVLKCRNMR